ncbi:MAG: hypothetical protein IKX61_07950 [Prevotella sp.]|nr:hypothetical protein [Prevotella sp.]
MIMKKVILLAAALLSMGTAFAENDHVNNASDAYVMNVNTCSLGKTLALEGNQVDAVEYICDKFRMDMYRAGYSKEKVRQERLQQAVRKNLSYMRSVLNRDQYHTYVKLLNVTLHNRGLM